MICEVEIMKHAYRNFNFKVGDKVKFQLHEDHPHVLEGEITHYPRKCWRFWVKTKKNTLCIPKNQIEEIIIK